MFRNAIVVLLLALTGSGLSSAASQNGVEVRLRVLHEGDGRMVFEVTVSNKGTAPVYAMTNPQRADRSAGPYFIADENDPALLRCEVKTFPDPTYELYFNGTRVELKRLRPGEDNREAFSVALPLMRTVPPYGNEPSRPTVFENRFRRTQATVGILPASEGLDKLFEKLGTHSVHGLEPISPDEAKSPRIFEAQTLLTSNVVDF
jgi:hypothetical protein